MKRLLDFCVDHSEHTLEQYFCFRVHFSREYQQIKFSFDPVYFFSYGLFIGTAHFYVFMTSFNRHKYTMRFFDLRK